MALFLLVVYRWVLWPRVSRGAPPWSPCLSELMAWFLSVLFGHKRSAHVGSGSDFIWHYCWAFLALRHFGRIAGRLARP